MTEEEEQRLFDAEVKKRLDQKQGNTQPVDPSTGWGFRTKPSIKDGTELGREMFRRLVKQGYIKKN